MVENQILLEGLGAILSLKAGSPYGIMANVLNCNIVVSLKFIDAIKAHFLSNIIGKDKNSFIPPAMD